MNGPVWRDEEAIFSRDDEGVWGTRAADQVVEALGGPSILPGTTLVLADHDAAARRVVSHDPTATDTQNVEVDFA